MSEILRCPRCDTRVTAPRAKGLRGICPKCLFEALLAPDEDAPRSPLELLEGHDLGNYVVQGLLGTGGMGVVYRARQRGLDRAVALKILNPRGTVRKEDVERFFREAKAAARLQHPNIVTIHEVANDRGYYFFTMDLVEGRTLADEIKEGKRTARDLAALVARVARAVHYAHEAGIIHRDLKPSNILIDRQGDPKVMDFGLAKDISSDVGLTTTGITMGTPSYMPPEQAAAERENIDARSDVYALGAVLYECLTDMPPFVGQNAGEILRKVLEQDPLPPRKMRPGVPRDIETICLKALRKERGLRYPSALAFAEDIERFLRGEPVLGRRPGVTYRLRRLTARHALAAALLAVTVSLGAALTWALWFRPSEPPPTPAPLVVAPPTDELAPLLREVERLLADSREVRDPALRPSRHNWLCEAAKLSQGILERDPQNAQAHFLRGMVAEQQFDLEAAAGSYTTALLHDPRHAEARFHRAWTFFLRVLSDQMQVGAPADPYLAETLADDAETLRQSDARADWIEVADALRALVEAYPDRLGQDRAAALAPVEEAARRAIGHNPRNPQAYFVLALSAGLRSDLEAMVSALGTALDPEPNNPILLAYRASSLAQLGRADEALIAGRLAAEVAPDVPDAHLALALVHCLAGRADDCKREIEQAVALAKNPARVHALAAAIYSGQLTLFQFQDRGVADFENALSIEHLRAAFEADPSNLTALTLVFEGGEAGPPFRVQMHADAAEAPPPVAQAQAPWPPPVRGRQTLRRSRADVEERLRWVLGESGATRVGALADQTMLGLVAEPAGEMSAEAYLQLAGQCAADGNTENAMRFIAQVVGPEWQDWKLIEENPALAGVVAEPAYREFKYRRALNPEEARRRARPIVDRARQAVEIAAQVRALDERQRRTERLHDALRELDRAERIDPSWAEIHFHRGEALRHLYRREEATEAFTRAILADPAHAGARYARAIANGEILLDEEIASMAPPDPYRLQTLESDADWLSSNEAPADQTEIARAFLVAVESQALAQSVWSHGQVPDELQSRLRGVVERIDSALAANPTNPHAHYLRGYAAWTLDPEAPDALDESIETLKRGLQYAPNDLSLLTSLTWDLVAAGRIEEARECARNLEAMAPDIDETHLHIALVHHAAGEFEARDRALSKALEISSSPAHIHLISAILELGLPFAWVETDMESVWMEAMADAPRVERAERSLDAALEADPNLGAALYLRASIRLSTRRTTEGVEDLHRLVGISPELARSNPYLADVLRSPQDLQPFDGYMEGLDESRRQGTNDLQVLSGYSLGTLWYTEPAQQRRLLAEMARIHARRGEREALLRTLARLAESDWHGWRRIERLPEFARFADDPAYRELRARHTLAPEESLRRARGFVERARQNIENAVRLTDPALRRDRSLWLRDATADLEQAVEVAPDWAEAHFWLGRAHAEAQRWERAKGHFGEAVRLDPSLLEARYHRILAEYGRWLSQALSFAGLRYAADPAVIDDAEMLRRSDAPRDWQLVSESLADSFALWTRIYALASEGEDPTERLGNLESLLTEMRDQGRRTIAAADEILRANPGNGYGYFLRANARALAQYDWTDTDHRPLPESLADLRLAIAREPNNPLFHSTLASYLLMAGDAEAALPEAEVLIELGPDSPEGYLTAARVYHAAGQPERVWEMYDAALRCADDPCPVRVARALALLGIDSLEVLSTVAAADATAYDRAIAELSAALSVHPEESNVLAIRAALRMGRGDIDGAREDYGRLAAIDPENPVAQYARANWEQLPQTREEVLLHSPEEIRAWVEAELAEGTPVEELLDQIVGWSSIYDEAVQVLPREQAEPIGFEIRYWYCALEALAGRTDEAVAGLQALLLAGWRDWDRFDRAREFDSIREDPKVAELRRQFPAEGDY